MGTWNDFYRWSRLREDNADVQWQIWTARKWIFEDGLLITSVYIKCILNDRSLTPT